MARKFASGIDLLKTEIRNFRFQRLPTDPEGSELYQGRPWFNTGDGKFKFFDGTTIQVLGTIENLRLSNFAVDAVTNDIPNATAGQVADAVTIRTYVSNLLTSFGNPVGAHDASTGLVPDGTGISAGAWWRVTVGGDIAGLGTLETADVIVAAIDTPVDAADFFVLQGNISNAVMFSETTATVDSLPVFSDSTGKNLKGSSTIFDTEGYLDTPVGFKVAGVAVPMSHGVQGGGNLHSAATTSEAGFMSPEDKIKLDGQVESNIEITPEGNVNIPAGKQYLVGGVALSTEHGNLGGGDLHALATETEAGFISPAEKAFLNQIDEADVEVTPDGNFNIPAGKQYLVGGVPISSEHGNLGGGDLHALATETEAGFMSSVDKTKLDSVAQSDIEVTPEGDFNIPAGKKYLAGGIETANSIYFSKPFDGSIWVENNGEYYCEIDITDQMPTNRDAIVEVRGTDGYEIEVDNYITVDGNLRLEAGLAFAGVAYITSKR